MARCFLSCLGTSAYEGCIYVAPDGRESTPVRYVQEATLQFFCRAWTKEDRLLIFTTSEAYHKNWLDNGHQKDQPGLQSRLQELGLVSQTQAVMIPEGKNIEEIWQIFQILYDNLQEGDRVTCDITHAFRSLPVLVLAVLGYARTMKQVVPEGIYYGAFEVLGTVPYVKEKIPRVEDRRAPLFDLTPFAVLLDWTSAIDRFLAGGDARMACELADKEIRPLLRESRGRDQAAGAIKIIAGHLQGLTKAVSTCRGPDLPKKFSDLPEALQACPRPDLLPPFAPLLKLLEDKFWGYQEKFRHPFLIAVRWCAEHNLIQQGFTILQEGLISYLLEKVLGETSENVKDRKFRDLVPQSVKIHMDNLEKEKWLEPARSQPEKIEKLLPFWNQNQRLLNIFSNLTQYRNDLNHAGFLSDPKKPDNFFAKLQELLTQMETLLI
jgi:CRISPR-associated Csx2 family protein